jgi:hypothetical protein
MNEPHVTVTGYTVSCLPEDHRDYRHPGLHVTYHCQGLRSVAHTGLVLSGTGQWDIDTHPKRSTE